MGYENRNGSHSHHKKGLALLAFLSTLGFVEVEQPAESAFVPGKFKPGEKPSDFAGVWATMKERQKASESRHGQENHNVRYGCNPKNT